VGGGRSNSHQLFTVRDLLTLERVSDVKIEVGVRRKGGGNTKEKPGHQVVKKRSRVRTYEREVKEVGGSGGGGKGLEGLRRVSPLSQAIG